MNRQKFSYKSLLRKNLYSHTSFVRPCLFAISLGLCVIPTQNGFAATVTYGPGNFNRDIIGNGSAADSYYSVGGTNNIATHGNNIYSQGNTVDVTGGTVDDGIYGGYYIGSAPGADISSNNNTVTIESTFPGNSSLRIYGGFARSDSEFSMASSNNTVNIYGGQASILYGGLAFNNSMTGSITTTASGNTINITGGTIDEVYGGSATSVYRSGTHAASGNTINISGGTVGSTILGGYVDARYGTGTATNNTVTISGSPNLIAANFYGGFLDTHTTGDAFSGNTLNVRTTGLTVGSVQNFQYVTFYLPSAFSATDTVLTVTGTANLAGSTVRLDGDGRTANTSYTVVAAGSLTTTGLTLVSDGYSGNTWRIEGNTLIVTLGSVAGAAQWSDKGAAAGGTTAGLGSALDSLSFPTPGRPRPCGRWRRTRWRRS